MEVQPPIRASCQHYETFHHICSHSTWVKIHSIHCPLHPNYSAPLTTYALSFLPFPVSRIIQTVFQGSCPEPEILTIDYTFTICNTCPSVRMEPMPALKVPGYLREQRREAAVGRWAELNGKRSLEVFVDELDEMITHGVWAWGMVEEARRAMNLEQLRGWAVEKGQELELRDRERNRNRYARVPLPPAFGFPAPQRPPAPEPEPEEEGEIQCGICMEDIDPVKYRRAQALGSAGPTHGEAGSADVVALPCPAHHTFHLDCIMPWMKRPVLVKTCPMDRVVVCFADCEREFGGPFTVKWWKGKRPI